MGVPATSVEIPIRAILRVKARILRKIFEIRRLAYGRGTSVTSLFGYCGRRATRPRKAERTNCLVSTESDEVTTREERYGGGGINSVYENNFVHTAKQAVSHASWSFGCVVKAYCINMKLPRKKEVMNEYMYACMCAIRSPCNLFRC